MRIEARYVSNVEALAIREGVAVVVDVVRAFTTAAWAFERGVERIVLTDDLTQALLLKAQIPGSLALKDGLPEPGFDMVNSPALIRDSEHLQGKTLVQRTTHGTIGAVAARGARRLFCAGFPTAAATAAAVSAWGDLQVWLVVTGEEGAADEDRACAEYIAALIEDPTTAPDTYVARVAGSNAGRRISQLARAGSPAAHIDDVEMCTQANRFSFTMRVSEEDGLLVLRREEI